MRAARTLSLLLLLLLAPAAPAARAQGDGPVVRLVPEVVAHHDRLTLADVAEIWASNASQGERLRAVALGYAPNVGMKRELTRDKVVLAVTAAFPEGGVYIEGPEVVVVRRAARTFDPAIVREAVERVALADMRARGATARLVRLDLPPAIEVPAGTPTARATMGNTRDLFSPFVVSVELLVDGRVVRRMGVTAQVEAFAPVVVAARDLRANSRLRPDDLRVEVRRLERRAALYLTDKDRLRGVGVGRAIAAGEPLTTDVVVAQLVVKPGDQVRIVGETRALSIAAAGVARASGRVGDRIQVKNLQSGLLLQAVVVDEGLVRVVF
jgi:flagella basal body P-ring formation protein FlgA